MGVVVKTKTPMENLIGARSSILVKWSYGQRYKKLFIQTSKNAHQKDYPRMELNQWNSSKQSSLKIMQLQA